MTDDTDSGIDMDKAVSEVAAGLNLNTEEPDDTETDDIAEPVETDATIVTEPPKSTVSTGSPESPESPEPVVRAAPKSWPKEMHEHWAKTDPKVQEYWETREKQMLDGLEGYKADAGFGKQIKEIAAPYTAMLQAQNIDAPKAFQYLLNAHYKLSSAQPSERPALISQLLKQYGIDPADFKPADETPVDPKVKALEERVNQLHTSLTARERAALTEAQSRIAKDVEAFASDPAHPYFEEVAEDIVAMIQAGHELKDAYEKAIWANPVTRQKEIARLNTENETKLREKAKAEAEKAKKASGSNVRSRDTRKAPTEPKGSMEDTLHETMREINSRAH